MGKQDTDARPSGEITSGRRSVLAAVASAATLSGCLGDQPSIELQVPDNSDYFDHVDYRPDVVGYSQIKIELHDEFPKPTVVLLFVGGKQTAIGHVATGENTITISVDRHAESNIQDETEMSLAAVVHGREESEQWFGGDILERVDLYATQIVTDGGTARPGNEITHETIENHLQEEMDWPQYYVSGENVGEENFVPAYYRVKGPNGPVSYINPNGDPQPTTMHDFAMEAQSDSFRWCEREETPWTRVEECD